MLDRLSVNAILKTVIAALSAVVVIMLAAGAWSSFVVNVSAPSALREHVSARGPALPSDRGSVGMAY